MEPVKHNPPASLNKYVEYLWSLRCPADGLFTLKLFANGKSGIIVQSHEGSSALRRTDETQTSGNADIPLAFLYGNRTRPGNLIARGPFDLTGVVFRPHALRTLLRINPAEVKNGPVNVDALFASRFAEELLNAATEQERFAILRRCLSARVADGPAEDLLVSAGLRLLRRHMRTIRIPQLLKDLGLSERQFQRRFKRVVGISPHHYLRVLRFHEAMRLLRERRFEKMSDLACELNYTDQSHFVKEVKEFSGCTPSGLRETVRTSIHLPCALISDHGTTGDPPAGS